MTAYLKPVSNRGNLRTVTGALRIEAIVDGALQSMGVDGKLVLSAGAINSPQLLMLLGNNSAEHLREMSIQVQVDAP